VLKNLLTDCDSHKTTNPPIYPAKKLNRGIKDINTISTKSPLVTLSDLW
jgi:hypothetical protein